MIQRVPNKIDKIKGDTFVDVYLIGSIKSLNIRLDHRDKKSLNVIKKNIEVKLPSIPVSYTHLTLPTNGTV